jgi:hypothetical protein
MTEQLACVVDDTVRFPDGDDLGRSRGTDFYFADDHLTGRERDLRDRVRRFCDTQVVPVDHHVTRHHADIEAVYTYEGTDSIQSLIVGRAVTGLSAFT